MNKRDLLLSLVDPNGKPDTVPAAFFLHFDPAYHAGQAAVDKHLEYFHYTDMDFVKIQFELPFPKQPQIRNPEDWSTLPFFGLDHYEPMLKVVEGLVKAAKNEALVILTLYSPFMLCNDMAGMESVTQHVEQDPDAFKAGISRMTESLLGFVRAAIRLGLDGFYTSTQGGEAGRLSDPALFDACVRPYDLAIMNEVNASCIFNILHVCDYALPYASLDRYADYPGHVVNAGLQMADGSHLTGEEVAALFKRPFMGGLERKGVISKGTPDEIRRVVRARLDSAPERTILGADCTVPADTSWDNLRLAIQTAHEYRG
ncbi:MAG: uroporphyrinogen decarboxylase family protein [Nitrososphaerales archaeon]